MPKISRSGGNLFWRIAEVGRKPEERRLGLLHGLGVHLQELLVTLLAQNVANGGALVEGAQRSAKRGYVEGRAFASLNHLGDK
ncbi:MAG: hypothetical protein DMG49_16775 [Acidobacteria bacterium]|nr:MAG: hypothetical protein DMG49_16775 [Acidobacteriota bacterium]